MAIHSDSSYSGSVGEVQVDSQGNIYACGNYRGTGDIDPNPAVSNQLSVTGGGSSVVSKYSPSGNLLWHVLLDATEDDQILDCALHPSENYLAVAGKFKGTMNFPSQPNITSNGDYDAYVAWISTTTSNTDTTPPNGVARGLTLGGPGVDEARGVDYGPNGSIYVGGVFEDTADIDWKRNSATNRTSAGGQDAFLTKFGGAAGTVKWNRTWGGTGTDAVHGLAVDRDNNDIYIGGHLGNQASDYNPGSGVVLIGGTSGGNGGNDSWISQFSPMGDLQWAKNFGSSSHDKAYALAAAGGYVYATGIQTGPNGDWDTGAGITTLGSSSYDPYTIKLNSSGLTEWVRAIGGSGTVGTPAGFAVAVDGSGNVYTSGNYRGTADLDSSSGTNIVTAYDAGGSKHQAFLLKHDADGDPVWEKDFTSHGNTFPYGLTTAGSDVYMSGFFADWMDFDPSAGDSTIRSGGNSDGFVAKYTSAGALATGNPAETANPPSGFDVIDGPVDGAELQGFNAEVVLATPLCAGGKWEMDHPHNGTSVRHYVVQDSALAASGLGIGAYIKSNYKFAGSTIPDHNLLWTTSQIDHDGGTSARRGAFKPLGWGGGFDKDVYNAQDPITFQRDGDGSFKWTKTGVSVWSASTVDYDGSGSSATGVVPSGWSVYMAFAAKNRNTTRTLTSEQLNISHSSCGSPGFTVTPSAGSTGVSETGTTDTFTVVLTDAPSSNVVISATSNDTGEATVSTASLTFTTGNWNTAQTVTVTGIDDDVDDGDQTSTVTLSVNDSSSDDNFDPLADQTVSVTTTDNDTAGFTLSGTTASVSETGTTDTFTVVLDSEPTGNVVFSLSSADTGEATVSPAALTFTSSNWDTAQTVTVTGIDDSASDGNQTTDVTVTVNDSSTADSTYDALGDQAVAVTTADDDSPGFTVAASGGDTTVTESGGTDTFTVVLTSKPAGNVEFSLSSADTGEATVAPSTLTFTDVNWDVAQTVTVTGVDDSATD
ncbi:MAG: hypothetical protein QF548_04700, partial [Acidimicrobiales bacterium]|nr:hypothetical protein [Acidimicrobiales bacterium]